MQILVKVTNFNLEGKIWLTMHCNPFGHFISIIYSAYAAYDAYKTY